ncbi:MAG: hypothetical protein Q7T63_16910, partial [Burkholderiaceae bacterium]|nr:hypothetical protein [Burkholderiaceae bacterium]
MRPHGPVLIARRYPPLSGGVSGRDPPTQRAARLRIPSGTPSPSGPSVFPIQPENTMNLAMLDREQLED